MSKEVRSGLFKLAVALLAVLTFFSMSHAQALSDSEAAGLKLKVAKNASEAYSLMKAAYDDCMSAISSFGRGDSTSQDADQKLKIYIYYKTQYEKLLKKTSGDQTPAAKPAETSEPAPATPAVSSKTLKADLDAIVKYMPSVAAVPQEKGGKFWRKLFGRRTIEDFMFEGYSAMQKGDFAAALAGFDTVLKKDPANRQAIYYKIQCLANSGQTAEAEKLASVMKKNLKDDAWAKAFRNATDPWVEAQVAFKIGGFDSLEQYKQKIAAGNRKELHSDEYYEKYVNPRTWNYYSASARKEFESIAGIDCGGFVQRVYMDLCKQNGIKPPFNSKVPGRQLQNYGTQLKEDGNVPPMTAKPGDFILLKEHDGWGHAFYFAGRDSEGFPLIVEASGEGKVLARRMPERYYQYYDGTYKFKDMDKIRDKMSLPGVAN